MGSSTLAARLVSLVAALVHVLVLVAHVFVLEVRFLWKFRFDLLLLVLCLYAVLLSFVLLLRVEAVVLDFTVGFMDCRVDGGEFSVPRCGVELYLPNCSPRRACTLSTASLAFAFA